MGEVDYLGYAYPKSVKRIWWLWGLERVGIYLENEHMRWLHFVEDQFH
jgi:hypothetical protein